MNTQQRLRDSANSIRRKSYPISDLIPLLQEAADRIDVLELKLQETKECLTSGARVWDALDVIKSAE